MAASASPPSSTTDRSRRNFLIGSGATLLAAGVVRAQQGLPPLAPPDKQPPNLKVPEPVTKTVGYAIVGLGELAIGDVLPQFAGSKFCKPTALVSGHRDKAEKVAEVYGVESAHIYGYDNYDALKDDKAVDVVYVILPNHMHAEYTIRALEAGKHVLCEKPMAPTVAECERMIAAAKANNRKLMIAYRLRYEPHNQTAIELARSQAYGKIQSIEAVNLQVTKAPNIRLAKETAGGPLGDVGIYCLNACRYLTGEEPTEFVGLQHRPADNPNFREVPSTLSWTMKFPSGVIANCSCGFNAHESRRFRVHCEKGWFELDPAFAYTGLEMNIYDKNGKHRVKLPQVQQFAAEMDHFAECVLNDRTPWTPGEEGLADMKAIAAIEKSIATGTVVRMA